MMVSAKYMPMTEPLRDNPRQAILFCCRPVGAAISRLFPRLLFAKLALARQLSLAVHVSTQHLGHRDAARGLGGDEDDGDLPRAGALRCPGDGRTSGLCAWQQCVRADGEGPQD